MQRERRIKNQLAVSIAVGTVLTACQVSTPAQAAQQGAEDQPTVKVNQVKRVCIRLVENGKVVDRIVVTGKAGESVPISKAKRETFVLTDGKQLLRMPAVFTIPQEDQVDWSVTKRHIAQQQVHDVVVTVQPEVDHQPIAGAPTEEVRLKVVASYQYDRLNKRKVDIKYKLAPGENGVVFPQSLPGYESNDANGIPLAPQNLVKDHKDLAIFLDNDDPAPLHFTVASHYRALATAEDSKQPKEGQPESPDKQDHGQPGADEKADQTTEHPGHSKDETADPTKDDGAEQQQPGSKGQQDGNEPTQKEPQDQVDEVQQNTKDTSNVADAGTQTEVESPDKVDASQQTVDEKNDVANVSTQTAEQSQDQVDAAQQTAEETHNGVEEGTQTPAEAEGQADASQQTDEETNDVADAGTQTPADSHEKVDSSQQTTGETSHSTDMSTQTEVELKDQVDASQQTAEETNDVADEGTQTAVEQEAVKTDDQHSELSNGWQEPAEEGHQKSTVGKDATMPDKALAAETEKLSQLDRQNVQTSAKDQLPQTGDSDQGRLIAALGGLISGLTGITAAWFSRRVD